MTHAANATILVVVFCTAAGCAAIAGFDDFSEGCPPGMIKQASSDGLPTCVFAPDAGKEGSGGSGNHGGAASDGGTTGGAGGREAAAGRATSTGGASGTASGGGAATSGGAGGNGIVGPGRDAASPACVAAGDPRFRGAAMARVVRPDGTAFLIDRTEVTFAEYDEFLRSHPEASSDTRCAGSPNTGSGPLSPACEQLLRAPDGGTKIDERLPRVCVDWCDAREYCQWAGKTLCADTTSTAPARLLEGSAFYVACTLGGSLFGCGASCRPTDCNGDDSQIGHADPPGAKTECVVGDPGCAIADLSGNVEEWTAGEDRTTPDGLCVVRGGSFDSPADELKCAMKKESPRRTTSIALGFRCCVEPWEG